LPRTTLPKSLAIVVEQLQGIMAQKSLQQTNWEHHREVN
jgi:hypothetical protein